MRRTLLVATMLAGAPTLAVAQNLAARVNAVADGQVQFTYAARPGVCGNGRTYISTGPDQYVGTFTGVVGDVVRNDPCAPGPVRVVVTRAGGDVIAVDTYVGPPPAGGGGGGATSLGTVAGRDAAAYLLSVAARSDGKPGRDALLPAMLADSATTWPTLLEISRDKSRPRETRRGAISWLGRDVDGQGRPPGDRVAGALTAIARDRDDNQQVRQQAVAVLSRLERGEGVPALVDLSRDAADSWLAKQAITSLARSGDPRARQFLRTAVQRTDLPEDVLVTAIRSIGRDYATSKDAEFLRGLYPRLTTDVTRESVVGTVAEMGGAENVRWLLGLVRDDGQSLRIRRRALQVAGQAGATTREMVGLYDSVGDAPLKETLIGLYAQNGEAAAVDKLLAIVKAEADRNLRRRTISALSRSEDPRVKKVLAEIVER